jgi:hypothetical protein
LLIARVKYLALLPLLLPACRGNPVVATDDALDVIFTTDKSLYALREDVTLWIENKMPDPILIRDCIQIERREAGTWELVGNQGSCRGTFSPVEVGLMKELRPGALDAVVSEGTYRFANDVLLQQDWKQSARVYTGAIEVR